MWSLYFVHLYVGKLLSQSQRKSEMCIRQRPLPFVELIIVISPGDLIVCSLHNRIFNPEGSSFVPTLSSTFLTWCWYVVTWILYYRNILATGSWPLYFPCCKQSNFPKDQEKDPDPNPHVRNDFLFHTPHRHRNFMLKLCLWIPFSLQDSERLALAGLLFGIENWAPNPEMIPPKKNW